MGNMGTPEIILGVSMAFLGALFSYGVMVFFRSRRYRELDILFGPWISSYQTLDTAQREWIEEAVQIDSHGGHMRITNSTNTRGYSYVATMDLEGDRYLHGEWLTSKGKDADRGVLVFRISKNYEFIYGYWTGPNNTDSTQFVGWVLAKLQPDIIRAKDALKSASQTFS